MWHEDIETGATLARPAFEQLQKTIFSGEVDALVVWKLDRISRDMRDGINLLAASALPSVALHRRITADTAASGALGRALALGL